MNLKSALKFFFWNKGWIIKDFEIEFELKKKGWMK